MLKVAADTSHECARNHLHLRNAILKDKIYAAGSESDVRQAVLALYDLDLVGNLEKHRIDYFNPELLIEFKYKADLNDLGVKCKVLAQMIHYLYKMVIEEHEFELPETVCLVNRTNFIFYDTTNFIKYLFDSSNFAGITSPSKDHPVLERLLRRDPNINGLSFSTISDYSHIWDELSKRGIYEFEHDY